MSALFFKQWHKYTRKTRSICMRQREKKKHSYLHIKCLEMAQKTQFYCQVLGRESQCTTFCFYCNSELCLFGHVCSFLLFQRRMEREMPYTIHRIGSNRKSRTLLNKIIYSRSLPQTFRSAIFPYHNQYCFLLCL